MNKDQRDFIDFMVRCGVLRFGDFVAKSGRRTPYFIDTGRYRSGSQLATLGSYYARTILNSGIEFNLLFGPAYKGIPVVVATGIALHQEFGKEVDLCFNRKEEKDHGEKGVFIGHTPKDGDRVLIIEDVTTAGTSIRETVPLLREHGDVQLAGLVVAVDRMERGNDERSAFEELSATFGMPCLGIVNVQQIIEHLSNRAVDGTVVMGDAERSAMEAYLQRYGGRPRVR